MRTLAVLTVGVSLVIGLQAADNGPDKVAADGPARPASGTVAPAREFAARQQAAQSAMQDHDYGAAARLLEVCVTESATAAERVTSLAWYGIALHRLNRNTEARPAFEQALAEWADTDQTPPGERIAVTSLLAAVDRKLGDYQSAERLLRSAIAEKPVSHEQQAMLMVSLADILREQLRDAEAAALANEAGRLTGLSHQQETSVMIESAELARDMGLRGESIEMWNRIEEVALREHSARLEAVAAGGLGETWFTLGNLARAEPLLRRSLQLLRDDPSSAPSQLATALSLMARLYMDENKLALAGEAVDEAIEKDGVGLGIDHPQIATLLELKAAILSRRGEAEPAREDLERARGIMSAHFGPDSAAVAGVLAALGDVEERANRPGAAVAEYEKAVKLLRGSGPETLKLGTEIVTRYAAALKADHRPEEARAVLRNLQASRAPDRDPAPAENAAASQPAAAKSFR